MTTAQRQARYRARRKATIAALRARIEELEAELALLRPTDGA